MAKYFYNDSTKLGEIHFDDGAICILENTEAENLNLALEKFEDEDEKQQILETFHSKGFMPQHRR